MASHQQIAGVTDEDLVQRMINSHDDRFDAIFWQFFTEDIEPRLPASPVIVDLGCGPGLFLRDVAQRIEGGQLHGFDLTPAMIDYAQNQVSYGAANAKFSVLDLTAAPVPLPDASVDLVAMTAVLHVLDDPLQTCAELKRLLAPGGTFLLFDWIKQPLEKYMQMMMANVPPERAVVMEKAMMRLSVAHNKYEIEDWIWLLEKGGFEVVVHQQLRSEHFHAFVCQAQGDSAG